MLPLIGVGLAAGVLSGLLGVGGGIVLVPLLIAVAKYDQHRAHANSLAAIFVIALAGMAGFAIAGEVSWGQGLIIAGGAIVGSTLGARTMGSLSPRVLRGIFVVVMVVAGIRMLAGGGVVEGSGLEGALAVVAAVAIGLVAGFAGAVAGIGGGVIIVPSTVFLLGLSQQTASGTSLLAIVFIAASATRVNVRAGRVRPSHAVALGLAGAVSSFLASQVAVSLDEHLLSRIFGVFVLIVAVRMARSLRRE